MNNILISAHYKVSTLQTIVPLKIHYFLPRMSSQTTSASASTASLASQVSDISTEISFATFNPKPIDIAGHFFDLNLPEAQRPGPNLWNCTLCNKSLTQNRLNGVSNLYNHIVQKHASDWKSKMYEAITSAKARNEPLARFFVDDKSKNLYGWMDWGIECGLPFTFVENENYRKYTRLSPICTKSYLKICETTLVMMKETIKSLLKGVKFGLITDGWDDGNGTHYFAVFCVFKKSTSPDATTLLLAMTPPIDETNFTAENIANTIDEIIQSYEKTRDDILFLVADNTNTMPALARRLGCPMIGCASHKLNLAVKRSLSALDPIIDKIDEIMKKMKTIKLRGLLRTITDIAPESRNRTRWSSTYKMVMKYQKLREVLVQIASQDDEVAALMLTQVEQNLVEELIGGLHDLQSCTLELQTGNGCNLAEVRTIFDAIIESIGENAEHYLAPRAYHDGFRVTDPDFESGIIKIIDDNINELTDEEKDAVEVFRLEPEELQANVSETNPPNFAKSILQKRKLPSNKPRYQDVKWIPTTSNVAERLFSKAKLTIGDLRKSMTPEHVEMILMLKSNRELWSLKTTGKIVMAKDSGF
jgi:hypothetical protein